MSFDCPNCWNTPCTCGYEYRDWDIKDIETMIRNLSTVIAIRKAGSFRVDDAWLRAELNRIDREYHDRQRAEGNHPRLA